MKPKKRCEKRLQTEKPHMFSHLYRKPQVTLETVKPKENCSKTEKPLIKGTKTAKPKTSRPPP